MILIFFTSSPAFVTFLNDDHPIGMKWYLIVTLILISLIINSQEFLW